jgi:GNAT superfamily N-acetyltransferase
VKLRTLARGERDAVLDLLDGWALPDGWRGRDFFRRYVEDDPRFREEDLWVAEEAGELVACVQIFPRRMRVASGEVALGGIGSVFTREDRRRTGAASALLARAVEAMRERGMALSLLFAARIAWYESLGWRRWPAARALWLREGAPAPTPAGLAFAALEPARDLDTVAAIHAEYSAGRSGTLVRDALAWRASLRVAGNPGEAFRVARRDGGIVAYARVIALEGHPVLSEFGRRPGPAAAADLAALLADAFGERGGAFGPVPADPELETELAGARLALRPMPDPSAMVRCLDAEALRAAAGLARVADETEGELLRRALPPERFLFWPADRF